MTKEQLFSYGVGGLTLEEGNHFYQSEPWYEEQLAAHWIKFCYAQYRVAKSRLDVQVQHAYENTEMTDKQIAKILGVSPDAVRMRAKRNGWKKHVSRVPNQ